MPDHYGSFIRRINEGPAREAILAFNAGLIRENDMAEVCWPYVMRVGSEIARRFGFGGTGNEDDFKSEAWLVFTEKIVPRFNGEWRGRKLQYLTPLVLKYFGHMAIHFKREMGLVLSHEEWITEKVGVDEIHPHDLITEIDADEIDKSRAKQKIVKMLAGVDKKGYHTAMENAKPLLPGFSPMSDDDLKGIIEDGTRPVTTRPKKRDLSCKPDHAELRHIRETLGYSQAVMAQRLGIGVPTYSSYEYGRTESVPEHIMVLAREELAIEKAQINTLRKKYDMPMVQIIHRWSAMAGIDQNSNQEVASLCGVSIPTVSRWRNNQIKPDLYALVRYEQNVIDRVSIRKKIEAELLSKTLAKHTHNDG
ncbi:helix-turn-helix transcriptional regulator [Ferrovum sp.]|uniref:helix-turn-helix domain-containing protein n=1 Tax=Ferrovum sp. TaxID=2609467 RepID=UPI00262432F9|nr:helix-turn-helix transcriptional regulator [Ferrovum sp.]